MDRRFPILLLAVMVVLGAATLMTAGDDSSHSGGSYDVTGTAIEACSCPLFCSCYYNPEPAGGHMCQFNMAYLFEEGSHWGDVDLAGTKIWISGDLGSHFGDGTTEWAVVTFDSAVSPEQRAAINGWIGKVFQVQWGDVDVREDEITWEDGEKQAHAKLASGLAEITLDKVFDASGQQSTVQNTGYWWANSNTGFRLARSTHYYKGEPSYSYKGRNGFMITVTAQGELSE